jgi:hypothetical protein
MINENTISQNFGIQIKYTKNNKKIQLRLGSVVPVAECLLC